MRDIDAALLDTERTAGSRNAHRESATLEIGFKPADVRVRRSAWAASYVGDCDDVLVIKRKNQALTAEIGVIVPASLVRDATTVESLLLPHLARFGLTFVALKLFPKESNSENCEVQVLPDLDSTLEELVYAACLLRDVVMASPVFASSEELFACLERGDVDSLIGVAESSVLDAKRTHYAKRENGHLELAIDVASFANSGQGGVLAIGVRTVKDVLGRDILAEVGGCDIDRGAEARYRKAIDTLVFPGVEGLRMCRTASALGEVFGIFVPRQDPAKLPFIVLGGDKRDAKHSSVVFQVPVRTGESNLPMRVEAVHSALRTWT
ncbi:hypothetical protein ACQP06_21615 [Nocardia sp. CA-136227]|uniref:hypothetical protein n=1 Tax=Nocardia sp. CA-136227 TaxID=3239979 RepID=UPI003D979EA6